MAPTPKSVPNPACPSETLQAMLERYCSVHNPKNRSQMARNLSVSPDVVRETFDDNRFERRVRESIADRRKAATLHVLAGTVVRLARGCGEDEHAWLAKLGFPKGIKPVKIDDFLP